jgi:glycosyltransferase involved in cell wall biosynthesis/DNA-binding MarR family transcriptional regulator
MKPTVSIIVPVYNAEKLLHRCVDSILQQTYHDFELFLIDDGSTDGSGAICDAYASQDARVHVLHQKNAGVSAARNRALKKAQGTYLQFLDSDDWIIPDATRLLVRAAEDNACDLVVADFYRVVGDRVSHKGDIGETNVLTRAQYAAHMMDNPADFYYGVLWNKLYRSDIVRQHHLRMNPQIRWCEDFMFNLEYIRHASSFYALQVPIYYYVKTKGSLVSQSTHGVSRTIAVKRAAFACYHQFYKYLLDEQEYEESRLKVYKFLIDAAGDGAVPPAIFPGSQRLGQERENVQADTVAGNGPFMEQLRERKLLQRYLEIAAVKNDLTMQEGTLLLYLHAAEHAGTRKQMADFTNMSRRAVNLALQKLENRGLILIRESAGAKGGKRERILLAAPAQAVVRDLLRAQDDYEEAALRTLTDEELESYAGLRDKIREAVLQSFES